MKEKDEGISVRKAKSIGKELHVKAKKTSSRGNYRRKGEGKGAVNERKRNAIRNSRYQAEEYRLKLRRERISRLQRTSSSGREDSKLTLQF